MSQLKKWLRVPVVQVILSILVLLIAFVIIYNGPKEPDPNIGLIPDPSPTVAITNSVGSLTVGRSIEYKGVQITVTQVQEAGKFSDDRKQAGTYTVRLNIHTQATEKVQEPLGIDYVSLVSLVLPNGEAITPKYITLPPLLFPQETKDGFIDFPVATQVPLSSLVFHMGSETLSFTG